MSIKYCCDDFKIAFTNTIHQGTNNDYFYLYDKSKTPYGYHLEFCPWCGKKL